MPLIAKLIATLQRSVFPTINQPQQGYLLLEIMPAGEASIHRQKVNFGIVLDRSNSMDGNRLAEMKNAAKDIVSQLDVDDRLSIVVFDETAEIVIPNGIVQNTDAILNTIDSITTQGGTAMSSGLELGLQQVQLGTSPNRISRLLILTDGRTWEDEKACEDLADQCRSIGIPMYLIGLGQGGPDEFAWNPVFLESLAGRSGGEWMPVEKEEDLKPIFSSILTDMQNTAITNTNLTVRFVENVKPRQVWRVTPLISRLPHREIGERDVQVFLGDVGNKQGQSLLIETLLPNREPGTYRLMQAELTYDEPYTGSTQQSHADVIITFTSDHQQARETNPKVMNIVERVTYHKLQTRALDEAAAGEIEKASSRLKATATRLLEIGEHELAQNAFETARGIEQAGQLDKATEQSMRYKTKRLTANSLEYNQ